jgi:hypothetical protein
LIAKLKLYAVSTEVGINACETYWYSSLALEAMDINELAKTVMKRVLAGVSHSAMKEKTPATATYMIMKWLMTRNKPINNLPIQL